MKNWNGQAECRLFKGAVHEEGEGEQEQVKTQQQLQQQMLQAPINFAQKPQVSLPTLQRVSTDVYVVRMCEFNYDILTL